MAVQVCEQIITGRNFDYERALEIIQNEEYLYDSDLARHSQKISHKHGQVLEKIETFEENFGQITKKFDPGENKAHREQRQILGSPDIFNSTLFNQTLTKAPYMLASTTFLAIAAILATNQPPGLAPSSAPQPGNFNFNHRGSQHSFL